MRITKILLLSALSTSLITPVFVPSVQAGIKKPIICIYGTKVDKACEARRARQNTGSAHIARRGGGLNPFTAIKFANSLNARGVTYVVEGQCESSCAIVWNLVKRKCWYSPNNKPPLFRQHATIEKSGKVVARVNPHSKSPAYWLKMGRLNERDPMPDTQWVEWKPGNNTKCTDRQAGLKSTDGNERDATNEFNVIGGDFVCARNENCWRRERMKSPTPSLFQ